MLLFKRSEYFFQNCCLIMYLQILYYVLTTQSSVTNKQVPHGKSLKKTVLTSAPAVWWMMAVLRATCFVGPLTSLSKKVWNNSTDLSSWDSVPRAICTQDQRGTHTKKHLWKDQEKHLPTSLTSPSGVFVIYTGIVNDLLKSFSSSNRVQYDMFLELAEATTEIETSLLLTGLVINCYLCLFVMTLNTEMSDLSRSNMSQ